MQPYYIYDIKYRQKGIDELTNVPHSKKDCFEFIYVVSGSGTLVIGENKYDIRSNTLYLINGECTHYTNPGGDELYVRSKLSLSIKWLRTVFDEVDKAIFERLQSDMRDDIICIELMPSELQMIDGIFLSLCYDAEKNLPSMFAKITELFSACISMSGREAKYDEMMMTILNYIHNNIAENITLERIAENVFISKYYLCHKFKKVMGVSVNKYIFENRMLIAQRLLEGTDYSVSVIARQSGFLSVSGFCHAFTSVYGVSPRKYREIKCK